MSSATVSPSPEPLDARGPRVHTHAAPLARPPKTAIFVARQIVDDITREGLGEGDRLPTETELRERYQVGRGTLREAMRFLESQGVVQLRPGPRGGALIGRPDAEPLATSLLLALQFNNAPFEQILDARLALEPLLARLAAQHITGERLAAVERSVAAMGDSLDGDLADYIDANSAFHLEIARASENVLYGFLIEALMGILDGTRAGVDYPPVRRRAVLRAHTRIYQALEAQDGDRSEAAMAAHMKEMAKYIEAKFPDSLRQPVQWNSMPHL